MNGHLRGNLPLLFGLDRPDFLRRYLARSFPFARVSSVIFALHGTLWNVFGIPTQLTHIPLVVLLTRYAPPLIFIIFSRWSRRYYHWIVCAAFFLFLSTTLTFQIFSFPAAMIGKYPMIAGRPYDELEIIYSYLIGIFYILFLTRIPFIHAFLLTIISFIYILAAIFYSEGLWHLTNQNSRNVYRLSSLSTVIALGLYVNYWLQARERALYEEKINTQSARMELKTKNRELGEMNDDKSNLISQLQDAKTELETKNHELDELNNDQAELMRRAGHNVRNGLLPIWGALDNINTILENNPVDLHLVREQIGKISTGFSLSIDVLNRLMGMNQYQTGKVVPELKLVDLREMVVKIHEQLHETASKKNIFLVYHLGRGPAVAYTDEIMMVECIFNLVNNSIKYTNNRNYPETGESPENPHGKRAVNAKLKNRPSSGVVIGVVPYHDVIRIHVVDTGIGIPESDMDNIWRPFFRVERKNSPEGLGLGLYTVSRIISALDSHRIAIPWSKEGIGSHFFIDIPRASLPAELLSGFPCGKADPIVDGSYILLIGKNNREIMETAHLIELWRGRVIHGPDARSVLRKIAENERRPDAIIVDYDCTARDGIDAIHAIRQKFGTPIPSIVIIGDLAVYEQSKQLEMSCLISKPFGYSELRNKLHEVLLMGKDSQEDKSRISIT